MDTISTVLNHISFVIDIPSLGADDVDAVEVDKVVLMVLGDVSTSTPIASVVLYTLFPSTVVVTCVDACLIAHISSLK